MDYLWDDQEELISPYAHMMKRFVLTMENSMIPLFHNEKIRLEHSIIGPTIP